MTEEQIAQKAREMYHRPRADVKEAAVELVEPVRISRGSSPGAWVQAWCWVPIGGDSGEATPGEKPEGR